MNFQFSRSVVSDWLFVTPWIAAHQGSLSITNSWSFLKLMSMESVMPSNHHILCHPLLLPSIFPSIRVFSNELFLPSGGQRVGASASASALPIKLYVMNFISIQKKGCENKENQWRCKCGSISGLSSPFQWSVCFLYQHHLILIIVALL